ncbi:MAG: tripartite tricarboxylate transporter substrate binding protein [Pigmentiphaga sp.]|uniref:Bug family tripartite tricarboxylate transporter substrate binding protein n=1 Tax=Pigmentiphaga sp. TaxID=1977564 RepID=UPI0029AFF87A|nr:tripartite tricarboxylate transporter substrate binding protein [Pigmentiphaga sp.]MDX3906728.1 tripartite tricarboxylate transporter substrate binding protein [Pigmentiphaga sp.]
MMVTSKLAAKAAAAILTIVSASAMAQTFPSKPIRIVAPYVPGGTVDVLSRALAVQLTEEFGQQVVVENRAGASGNIGAEYVASSEPDGHVLLVTASTVIVNPLVMKEKQPFDLQKDFTPIGMVASTPLVFVVSPQSGINTVDDFIKHAKAHPDKVNFGVGGFGSGGHLAMETFNVRAGTAIPMVIYKGSAPALADIVGGQLSAIMDPVLTTLPFVNTGRLKAIAVTGERRSALLPSVPTLGEAGVPDMDFVSWYGMWGPAGMPEAVSSRIQAALTKVLGSSQFKAWLDKQGMVAGTVTGKQFGEYVQKESRKYAQAVEQAKIEKK